MTSPVFSRALAEQHRIYHFTPFPTRLPEYPSFVKTTYAEALKLSHQQQGKISHSVSVHSSSDFARRSANVHIQRLAPACRPLRFIYLFPKITAPVFHRLVCCTCCHRCHHYPDESSEARIGGIIVLTTIITASSTLSSFEARAPCLPTIAIYAGS